MSCRAVRRSASRRPAAWWPVRRWCSRTSAFADLGVVAPAFVALAFVASVGIIVSTLPLLKRIIGPEAARNG
ncbi:MULTISPECIES: hypothetical protein [Streptomyces]|uniref:hypothetical protein n=1 Tax=Streptomyces TaxID=1883 RepID=UPI0004BF40CA|nr:MULTISPECIES: hypothetical protein [Streptomyces]